jgi:hypothetical protein
MQMTGYEEKQKTQANQHFFAASIYDWARTTPERDLRDLMKLMDKFGHGYNLFLVPLPYEDQYEINFFQPQVEGTKWLGFFDKKGKTK